MRISAPTSQYTAEFTENFDTYVAFMQAFRAVWTSYLDPESPVTVAEGDADYSNYDGTGSPANQTGQAPEGTKYDYFLTEIQKMMEFAANQGWIQIV
jgi:hypothetical protein